MTSDVSYVKVPIINTPGYRHFASTVELDDLGAWAVSNAYAFPPNAVQTFAHTGRQTLGLYPWNRDDDHPFNLACTWHVTWPIEFNCKSIAVQYGDGTDIDIQVYEIPEESMEIWFVRKLFCFKLILKVIQYLIVLCIVCLILENGLE